MDEDNFACQMGWCIPSRICGICPFHKVEKADSSTIKVKLTIACLCANALSRIIKKKTDSR